MSDNTDIAVRMKEYERRFTELRCMQMVPMLCRIDGKCFHTFTRGLGRPYDERLSNLMVDTAKSLLKETHANCAYTQSDEISLCWYTGRIDAEQFFGGKAQKVASICASIATAFFNSHLSRIPEKDGELALFDARVWELPNIHEAANYFVWREQDATRNSIAMAAQSVYSHKELYDRNCSEMQEMLFQKGINWNDYPRFFKRGTYVRKRIVDRPFMPEEVAALPPRHNYFKNQDMVVRRSVVMTEDMPVITKVINRAEVLLMGDDPIVGQEPTQ